MNYLFYGFLGYWAMSITFFIFPYKKKDPFKNPIYQKIKQRKAILHISHRGGSRENLENTLQAFQHAVQQGTDCIEMDVCMTKDKKIVVLHDSSLLRMCGVDDHVKNFNYNELPKFLEQVRLDFAPNDYIQTKTCSTPYIPLFEDILKKFPDVLINVEIKTPEPEVIKVVNDLIVKYNRQDTIIWGVKCKCFKLKQVEKYSPLVREINPNIPRFFTAEGILRLYGLYITGLLPFFDLPDDSVQAPLFTNDFYQWKLNCAQTKGQKVSTIIFHNFLWVLGLISKPLFSHLHKRGIFVYYWVLNNDQEYDRAINTGCHGIMTDCPTSLRQYLQKEKLYQKQ